MNNPSRERFELGLEYVPSPEVIERLESFYNTTSETGPQLAEYQAKAGEQNETVLAIFRKVGHPLSPSQVLGRWPMPFHGSIRPPLTSIRRAITTLTQAGALVKTEAKRKGVYGRMEHVWTLPDAVRQNATQEP